MKNQFGIFLVLTLITSACMKNSINADECSILLNDVTFTKSLNKGKDLIESVEQNKIIMRSGAKSDFFNAPNGKEKYSNAPLLLTPINNKRAFTFVAKVTPEFSETYDAGALYVFVNNDIWQKFAFEMDERKMTRLVSVRTNGTSDDNNHDAIEEKTVFMKISSDVESIGYYYSTDSISWQLTRVYKNDFPESIWLGISSQSPLGEGTSTKFESCSLSKTAIKNFRLGI